MKYLKRFLEAERQVSLSSVLSVPFAQDLDFSEEEEEGVKALTYKADRADKTDRSTSVSSVSEPFVTDGTDRSPTGSRPALRLIRGGRP